MCQRFFNKKMCLLFATSADEEEDHNDDCRHHNDAPYHSGLEDRVNSCTAGQSSKQAAE